MPRVTRRVRLGAALAGLAIGFALLRAWGPGSETAERAEPPSLGQLPYPSALPQSPMPADGTGRITYEVSATDNLPTKALAYRLEPRVFTRAQAQDIARGLGIAGPTSGVTRRGGAGVRVGYDGACDNTILSVAPGAPAAPARHDCVATSSLTVWDDGSIELRDGTVPVDGPPAEPAAAEAAVRAWMTAVFGDEPVEIAVGPSECRRRCRTLVARPALTPGLVGGLPALVFSVYAGARIAMVEGLWATPTESASYALHSLDDVTSALRVEYATFADLNLMEAPGADPMRDATVRVEAIGVAQAGGVTAGGRLFLVPSFVIRGMLDQEALPEPIPFAVWLPATETARRPPPAPIEAGEPPSLRGNWVGVFDWLPAPGGSEFVGERLGSLQLVESYVAPSAAAAIHADCGAALELRGWRKDRGPVFPGGAGLEQGSRDSYASYRSNGLRVAVVVDGPADASSPGRRYHIVVGAEG